MLKGFFYRRTPEGNASATDVNIRFEINSKESILAKATNLSSEGMQFVLPRGKVILVPEEKIILVLNQSEHGEFKIQSEVYYFCNTTDKDGNLVVCYGVKFLELSHATWEMVYDFCGPNLPDLTFTPQHQKPAAKPVPPVKSATPVIPVPPVPDFKTPESPVFTPVKIPMAPIPDIIPGDSIIAPAFANGVTNFPPPFSMEKTPVVPFDLPKPEATPVFTNEHLDKPTSHYDTPVVTPVIPIDPLPGANKKPAAVETPVNATHPTVTPKEPAQAPAQNSIQALAASLATPPAAQAQAKGQSMSQEMIDRLIERLQAEANAETAKTAEPLPQSNPVSNPALDRLMVTENELDSAKSSLVGQSQPAEPPVGIEYLLSKQSVEPESQPKNPYADFLIDHDPFIKTNKTESENTHPFTTALPTSPAASLFENLQSPEGKSPVPPVIRGTSMVDLIMDMDPATSSSDSNSFKSPTSAPEHSLYSSDDASVKPVAKKNQIPTVASEELHPPTPEVSRKDHSLLHEVTPKEKPAPKASEGFPVIPPIMSSSPGVSMDQKAIDKLVQSLLQEQSQAEATAVAEHTRPSDHLSYTAAMKNEKRASELKHEQTQSPVTPVGPPVINEKPLNIPTGAEVKESRGHQSGNPATPPVQPGNPAGMNLFMPDPTNNRVMDQKSIDLIVQTLTHGGGPNAPTSTAKSATPSYHNPTPVKNPAPGESRRTLDQKAIDQVVQALTQNQPGKSTSSPAAMPGAGKPFGQDFTTPGAGKSFGQDFAMPGTGKSFGQDFTTPGTGKSYNQDFTMPGTGKSFGQDFAMPGTGKSFGQDFATPGAGKSYNQDFTMPSIGKTPDHGSGKDKKNTFSLSALSASLHLDKGEVLQCSIEQIYLGGIMVQVNQDIPLNSAIKISILGEGTYITDIQGTCTNCEPGHSGKSGYLAEIFFKNLSNSHMEQFRTLIAKLDTK